MNQELDTFAEQVRRAAGRIAGLCAAGQADKAGIAALELCTLAATTKEQARMQGEVQQGYNLSALNVDTASASNSEMPFEDE